MLFDITSFAIQPKGKLTKMFDSHVGGFVANMLKVNIHEVVPTWLYRGCVCVCVCVCPHMVSCRTHTNMVLDKRPKGISWLTVSFLPPKYLSLPRPCKPGPAELLHHTHSLTHAWMYHYYTHTHTHTHSLTHSLTPTCMDISLLHTHTTRIHAFILSLHRAQTLPPPLMKKPTAHWWQKSETGPYSQSTSNWNKP